jgi:hypothetical protein
MFINNKNAHGVNLFPEYYGSIDLFAIHAPYEAVL